MAETQSKFSISFVRPVYITGPAREAAAIAALLKPYYFLSLRVGQTPDVGRGDAYFVIALADLTAPDGMQALARDLKTPPGGLAHNIVFVLEPGTVSREQLLYAQEVGARFVCSGPLRNEDLRDYIKRVCVEFHQTGSLASLEHDVEAAIQANDRKGLLACLNKLRDLPETEDVLRLQVAASEVLPDLRRVESGLRRVLTLNPQNLWAANALGRLYLRSGRGPEGLEILEKLSHFHDLSSDRLATVGEAQIIAGRDDDAEATFRKGQRLTGDRDERFRVGLAKVKLARQDHEGALSLLNLRQLSQEMISFLNTRAIMSIRSGRMDEGVAYYECAIRGTAASQDLQAKLKFNLGIAFIRTGDLKKAQGYLNESVALGGRRFTRARRPLAKVETLLQRIGREKIQESQQQELLDDASEWETLY